MSTRTRSSHPGGIRRSGEVTPIILPDGRLADPVDAARPDRPGGRTILPEPGGVLEGLLGLPPEESYDRIARLAAATVGAPVALVALVDDDDRATVKASVGLAGRAQAWRAVPAAHDLTMRAVAESMTIVVDGEEAETGGRALLVAPFHAYDAGVRGVVAVIGPAERRWSAEDRALLEELGEVLCTELELRREIVLRRSAQRTLLHSTLHDGLTGLPNRVLLSDRLDHALHRASRDPSYLFAVLFLDLDRFKIVNDSLGHHAGDELLIAVARRLESAVRPEDTVARLGGDEFVIFLESLAHEGDVDAIAGRIQHLLAAPVNVGGYEVFTSASMGIVLSSHLSSRNARPEYLLRNADMAMYRAKAAGRATHALFDVAMHRDALERLQLETELRHALDHGEFRLHYQPIVALDSGAIAGFEALLRWEHPERGLVGPGVFMDVAEDTGLMVPVSEWVLGEGCRQVRAWKDAGYFVTVAVNLSPKQFSHVDLVEQVRGALEASGIAPAQLHLEVTESVVIDRMDDAAEVLSGLKALGVQVHMDDFGTGYSSLSYLHQLPLDAIKVDRTFVSQMDTEDKALQLVRTMLTLADTVGLRTVAEGVATERQLRELRTLGCRFAQGFHFSPPVCATEAERLLGEGARW
jgi:diguanylate cyclase (GGDEF)-like protein